MQAALRDESSTQAHRPRVTGAVPFPSLGLITEALTRKDPRWHCPEGQAALLKEMQKLESRSTWLPTPIYLSTARKDKHAVFVRVFPLLGLKHAESSSPSFKGRVVASGDRLTDAFGQPAGWEAIATSPTSMEFIKHAVSFSLAAGEVPTSSDAIAAYVQAWLPEDWRVYIIVEAGLMTPQMKAESSKMTDGSICWRLVRPIYGLTISGKLWSQHLSKVLVEDGWEAIDGLPDVWRKCVDGDIALLVIYVDDLVMGGRRHRRHWASLQAKLELEDPATVSKVLGLSFKFNVYPGAIECRLSMDGFFQVCLARYADAGGLPLLKNCSSPTREFPVQAYSDPVMQGVGQLAPHAASLLMSILYGARMFRADLLCPINQLAQHMTKWTVMCDVKIRQIFSYLSCTLEMEQVNVIRSGCLHDLQLVSYPDADFAGEDASARSCSGAATFVSDCSGGAVLLSFHSKRQSATARSTTESEILSLSKAVNDAIIPSEMFWTSVLGRDLKVLVCEDNISTIRVVLAGYSVALRALPKHHRVSISFLNEALVDHPDRGIVHVRTHNQRGDICTKGLPAPSLIRARLMIGLLLPGQCLSPFTALGGLGDDPEEEDDLENEAGL